jgi:hypothetical protein
MEIARSSITDYLIKFLIIFMERIIVTLKITFELSLLKNNTQKYSEQIEATFFLKDLTFFQKI